MESIVIIGFGKVGSHLYYALKKTGKYRLSRVDTRHSLRNSSSIINKAGIIFICVQDSSISSTAKKLAGIKKGFEGKIIFHTSGSMTSEELLPLNKREAFTASFHPVQTFEAETKKDRGRLSNIYIAIEGSKQAITKGKLLAKSLGAFPFIISKKDKVYHHICCVIASNFLTALIGNIGQIGAKKIRINGFKNLSFFNIYKPLAVQTLKNIAAKGASKSLTGPVERNDLKTITKHIAALRSLPEDLLSIYSLLGIETVKLALKKKSISPKEAKTLLNTFNKYIKINKID